MILQYNFLSVVYLYGRICNLVLILPVNCWALLIEIKNYIQEARYVYKNKNKRHCFISMEAVVARISENASPYGNFLRSLI
jgi:hypothetical protein